jgi:diacylglycerol kinase (ATP)
VLQRDAANPVSAQNGIAHNAEVIFNPAGRGGAARDLSAEVARQFGGIGLSIRETRAPGDEERLAQDALARNVTTIIAVGGDGTCSNIANAIVRAGSTCRLAVVPAGTGNDFAKTLGVQKSSIADVVQLVLRGELTRIDVGRVGGRYFINSCGFGFDASVLDATTRVKILKGDALYIYAALRQLFTYKGLRIAVDGVFDATGKDILMVTVSNGRFLGGAFHIAPEASVLDGKLDVCVVRDANVLQRVRLFASAFRGTHGRLPAVQTIRTERISLTFPSPPAIELDGELRQAQSHEVTIECVPRALNVIAASNAPL